MFLPDSKETDLYYQFRAALREILLPAGFQESQEDLPTSLTKQTRFQKGTSQVCLLFDMRERQYTLLSGKQILFTLPYSGFGDNDLMAFQMAIEHWLEKQERLNSNGL